MAINAGDVVYQIKANTRGLTSANAAVKDFGRNCATAQKSVTKLTQSINSLTAAAAKLKAIGNINLNVTGAGATRRAAAGSVNTTGVQAGLAAASQAAAAATAAAQAATQASSAVNNLASSMNNASRSAGNFGNSIHRATGFLGNFVQGIKSVGTAFAAFLIFSGIEKAIVGVFTAMDKMTKIEGKIKLASQNQQEFNDGLRDVIKISKETGTDLESVAALYQKLAISVKTLGGTQEEALTMTKAITDSLIASGASASEANSSVTQLSQAFSKGTLNGDELRSVLENDQSLAIGLSKQLGILADRAEVSTGILIQMAQSGQLTFEQLKDAMIKIAPEMARQAALIEKTMGRSLEVLSTSVTVLIKQLDDSVGFSRGVSNAFIKLADNLDKVLSVVVALATYGLALLIASIGRSLLSIGKLTKAFRALWIVVAKSPVGLALSAFAGAFTYALSQVQQVKDGTADYMDAVEALGQVLYENIDKIHSTGDAFNFLTEILPNLTTLIEEYIDANQKGAMETNKFAADVKTAWDRLGNKFRPIMLEIVGDPAAQGIGEGARGTIDQLLGERDKILSETQDFGAEIAKNLVKSFSDAKVATSFDFMENVRGNIGEISSMFRDMGYDFSKMTEDELAASLEILGKKTGIVTNDLSTFFYTFAVKMDEARQRLVGKNLAKKMADTRVEILNTSREINQLGSGNTRQSVDAISQSIEDFSGLTNLSLQEINDRLGENYTSLLEARNAWALMIERASQLQVIKEITIEVGDAMGDMFLSIVTGAESAKDAINNLGKALVNIIAQQALIKPIFEPFGQVIGQYVGGFFNHGGTATSGQVSISPTDLFPTSPLNLGPTRQAGGAVSIGNMYKVNEAGPEYFQPLVPGRIRPASWNGAGGGNVQIIDQRGASAPPVETKTTTGPDGSKTLQVFIRQEVSRALSSGKLDGVMGDTYGIRRRSR